MNPTTTLKDVNLQFEKQTAPLRNGSLLKQLNGKSAVEQIRERHQRERDLIENAGSQHREMIDEAVGILQPLLNPAGDLMGQDGGDDFGQGLGLDQITDELRANLNAAQAEIQKAVEHAARREEWRDDMAIKTADAVIACSDSLDGVRQLLKAILDRLEGRE